MSWMGTPGGDEAAQYQEKVPLSVKEFFCGAHRSASPMGDVPHTILRVTIAVMLVVLTLTAGMLAMVVGTDYSAEHHQCEKDYVLWPHVTTNMALYFYIVASYCFTTTSAGARCQGFVVILATLMMIIWFVAIVSRIAHICTTFYLIKYPLLLDALYICVGINLSLFMGFLVRECFHMMAEEESDATLITHIFFKSNANYIPSLFEKRRVQTYKSGVSNWTVSVDQRNDTLKKTLEKAEKIHEQSNNQSQLLSQVTNLVKETDAKVTKAFTLIKEQEDLINDMKDVVGDASDRLENQQARFEDIFVGMTYCDICKWCGICWLCVFTVGGGLLAIPKWMHLLGINLGINI